MLVDLGENAFFLQCANCLSAKDHRNLLTVEFKSFLLEVRLKHTVSATQREAHIVAKLFTFAG